MKLKDMIEQYGEYDIEEWFEIGTDGIADEKGIKLKKPKPKTVWELEKGDRLYELNSDGAIEEDKYDFYYDDERSQGNIFLTKEEAEAEKERREIESLLLKHGGRRWFKNRECNYFLRDDDHLGNDFWVDEIGVSPVQGTIYFDNREQVENAISEIGADRIKKVFFEGR